MINNSSDLILDIIQDLNPTKNGIKFLINYLNDNYNTTNTSGRNPTLMEMFYLNVKNIPNLPQSRETWEKIKANGDVKNAIISAFDWDLSPEGSEYWFAVNTNFLNAYETAKQHGLKCNENTSMRNSNYSNGFYPHTAPYDFNGVASEEVAMLNNGNGKRHYTDIQILPSKETLSLMSYIAPVCNHLLNPQIDILNQVLVENKCKDEFYSNLRNKPKHTNYEKEFNNFIKDGDLRTIVYWAFNWSATKEGFHFWSKINGNVHSAITKELTNGGSREINSSQSLVLKRKHEEEGLINKPTPCHTPIRTPHLSACYGYHHNMFYDEDYYDNFYETYSALKVPNEIIKMPVNNNFIEINKVEVLSKSEPTYATTN